VEEFLRGLSSDDLDALEKYVVDDVVEQARVDGPAAADYQRTDYDDDAAVRTVPSDDDQLSTDDVGQSVFFCIAH